MCTKIIHARLFDNQPDQNAYNIRLNTFNCVFDEASKRWKFILNVQVAKQ